MEPRVEITRPLQLTGLQGIFFTIKASLNGQADCVLARKAAWTFETLTRMSKEHGSADYEYGSDCGSAKGAEQSVAFMCGGACASRHVRLL